MRTAHFERFDLKLFKIYANEQARTQQTTSKHCAPAQKKPQQNQIFVISQVPLQTSPYSGQIISPPVPKI